MLIQTRCGYADHSVDASSLAWPTGIHLVVSAVVVVVAVVGRTSYAVVGRLLRAEWASVGCRSRIGSVCAKSVRYQMRISSGSSVQLWIRVIVGDFDRRREGQPTLEIQNRRNKSHLF